MKNDIQKADRIILALLEELEDNLYVEFTNLRILKTKETGNLADEWFELLEEV